MDPSERLTCEELINHPYFDSKDIIDKNNEEVSRRRRQQDIRNQRSRAGVGRKQRFRSGLGDDKDCRGQG